MKKIIFNLKYFIIVLFLGLSVIVNANPINDQPHSSTLTTNSGMNNSINSMGGIITFYGTLDVFFPSSGTIIIDCDPPFTDVCYTMIYDSATPNKKTIILNDKNQTRFTVTSNPVITTGKNGEMIHTFVK